MIMGPLRHNRFKPELSTGSKFSPIRGLATSSGGRSRQARFEQLEDRRLLAATPIQVMAAGLSGQEQVQLQIEGVTVQTWNNVGGDFANRQFQTLEYTHPTDVSIDQVRVLFSEGLGTANDLLVDGVSVAGVFYQAEAANVFSTGNWDSSTNSCNPRFAQSEVLHCNGYLQFDANTGSTIQVLAAGAQGTESLAIEINGEQVAEFENVAGQYDAGIYQALQYTHTAPVTADEVRVVLLDGGANAAGDDQNLRVDAILIDGVRFESEHPNVFSTGSWSIDTSCNPGFKQSEFLHCSAGFFEYFELADTGSVIDVWAAGSTGTEQMQLLVDGTVVETWENIGGDYDLREFVNYKYNHRTTLTADRIRVAFVNDGTTSEGADKNLRIDGIAIDGDFFQAEAPTVQSTGTWDAVNGCEIGFKQSEALHCNGYLQFDASPANPGVISLATAQLNVPEQDGTVLVNFVRTGGSDGVATVDYTTVNATAIAGEDYGLSAGTVTFLDGQTSQTISIPITDDDLPEGTETFNIAIDLVTGATAGQPRTATVSIFDDELPSAGDGNGLQGEYFSGNNFGSSLLARTDVTVNFNWGFGAPASSVPDQNFSVRWTGQVQPLHSETYTFRTITDDGVRLWVNNQLIIDQWIDQAATTHTGTITLVAGQKYDLRMDYYENVGEASARLQWSSASQSLQTIPTTQLYSTPIVPTSGSFSGETIASGLNQPTSLEFAPTGQIFVAQKNGVVRVIENGSLLSGSFINLSSEVNNIQDRGLLGLELDPDFLNRPYVYLLYTYDPPQTQTSGGLAAPDAAGNRVSRLLRVTADASNGYRTHVPGSEIVLLGENSTWENISSPDQDGTNNVNLPPSCAGVEDCIPVDSRSHSIGALAFAPDGSLFVTNGDGTSFGRVDPRTVRVQDLDSLAGKVLRIDPDTGFGLPDNPFFQSSNPDSNRSKVYNYGLRNPFRLAVNPFTGEPFVSDVGWNAWEEINSGRGKNFGWPFYEGGNGQNLRTGGYQDLPEAAAFYADNNATPPIFSRSHSAGGVAIVIGDFYTGSLYPAQYRDSVFYTDFGEPTIRALRLNANGTVQQQLVVTGSVGTVIEMTMGPDGLMYYADLNGNIGRLRFNAAATQDETTPETITADAASASAAVVAEGSSVEVFGTKSDDVITLSAENGITAIEINGQGYPLAEGTNEIIIHGRAGDDRISLVGAAGRDVVTLGPGMLHWTLPGVVVTGDGLEAIVADAGDHPDSDDLVRIRDTSGDDLVTLEPKRATLNSGGYSLQANNFPNMTAYSTEGSDTAMLVGSGEAEQLLARPEKTRLAGPGYRATAVGFSTTVATAGGGKDSAVLHGSDGDDLLTATPESTRIEGPGYSNEVIGFTRTTSRAGGGYDVATMSDSQSNDRFRGYATRADLRGEGYFNVAIDFEQVTASASLGSDQAYLYPGSDSEALIDGSGNPRLSSGSFQYTAVNFPWSNASFGESVSAPVPIVGEGGEYYAHSLSVLPTEGIYYDQAFEVSRSTEFEIERSTTASLQVISSDELLQLAKQQAMLSLANQTHRHADPLNSLVVHERKLENENETHMSEADVEFIDSAFESIGAKLSLAN